MSIKLECKTKEECGRYCICQIAVQVRCPQFKPLPMHLRRNGILSSPKLQYSFLINEKILGKCFRSCSSCGDPRISPLAPQYECPRLSLLIITSMLYKTNKIEPKGRSPEPPFFFFFFSECTRVRDGNFVITMCFF